MHVTTTGRGPDLVLLHGWGMHGGIFAPLVPALERRCTLHFVDLPGHGRSAGSGDVLDFDATAARLVAALPAAVWLGWSLGGLFALEAARLAPSRVRGLALIAATPRFTVAPDWPHAVELAVFEQFARGLVEDYRGTLERFLALEVHGSDCARRELRALKQAVFAHGEPEWSALAAGLEILAHRDLRAALPSLPQPALWIAGARDLLVPPGALEAAAAAMPDARCVRIAGGGHAPFVGHPDAVLGELDALLDAVYA